MREGECNVLMAIMVIVGVDGLILCVCGRSIAILIHIDAFCAVARALTRAALSGKACHKECWGKYIQVICERCLHCNEPISPVEGRFGGEYIVRDDGQVIFLYFFIVCDKGTILLLLYLHEAVSLSFSL